MAPSAAPVRLSGTPAGVLSAGTRAAPQLSSPAARALLATAADAEGAVAWSLVHPVLLHGPQMASGHAAHMQ